ncbi:MAG: peptidylprolyl isomerase [Rhodomicrobium sp.]|nr:MAG: peptidylprolyl isomerase [Rhodomicrobium sp.]
MKIILKSVATGLLVLMAGSATLHAEEKSTAGDNIVAKVGPSTITEVDMTRAETEMFNQLVNVPKNARRKVLVEYLIETQLLADAAKEAKISETEDFKARQDYYHRRAMRDTYFDQQVFKSVSEADVKTTYDDAAKEEEAHVQHILVKEEEKAKELAKKIKDGGDFKELAKTNSIDPGSKDKGGDLGFILKTQVVPTFAKAAFDLEKKGDVSDPVQSQFGWHIIRLEEKRNRALPPYTEVKARIKEVLWQKKAQELIENLRKKSKIEFVDKELEKPLQDPRGSN